MKSLLLVVLGVVLSHGAYAKEVCKNVKLGVEQVKICADQVYGDDATVEFTNFKPDIAAKIEGFTVFSGAKKAAWEVCEIFDVFTDGIEVTTSKSSDEALYILESEKTGSMVKPEKDHRILDKVVCYEIY